MENNSAPTQTWHDRLLQFGRQARRGLPFVLGVAAALLGMLLYNRLLAPQPHQLTLQEVNDSVAQALASATPPPAYSAVVYQIIQPSLVFIRTESKTPDGEVQHGLGSGVIIDDRGDILTSLHVVTGTTEIKV